MRQPRAIELTPTPTPVLMINAGSDFSPQRTLSIEAEVSVIALDESQVPGAFATFQLMINDTPIDPQTRIVVNEISDEIFSGNTHSVVIKSTLLVGPGTYTVALFASSSQEMEINPGASLRVCESGR